MSLGPLLVLQRSILRRRSGMPSFLFPCAETNRKLYCDISISDVSHNLSTWTCCWSTFASHRPLFPTVHITRSPPGSSNTNAQFFKDVFFLLLLNHVDAFFQDTIVFLSIRPTFFYGKNEVLFMCDADNVSWSVKRWLKYYSKMCY